MNQYKKLVFLFAFIIVSLAAKASYILIPMDAESQRNHLKAYGVTFWVLENEVETYWLLNYRGEASYFNIVQERKQSSRSEE